jgi:hypothetical protein
MQAYINNPMLSAKVEKQQEECVFCLDGIPPPLIKNSSCACQYNYHPTCQKSYEARLIAEGKQPLCVMCRQPLPTDCEIALMTAHCQTTPIQVSIAVDSLVYGPSRCCHYISIVICTVITTVVLLILYRLFF